MTRLWGLLWVVLVAVAVLALPARADGMFGATGTSDRVGIGTPLQQAFGDCGNPCVVRENVGGRLYTFYLASKELQEKHINLVIDGPCYSACASIADRIRSSTCITDKAVFGFHLKHESIVVDNEAITFNFGKGRAAEQPQSDDVRAWVLRHGGFPAAATRYTLMYAKDAARFWRRCPG